MAILPREAIAQSKKVLPCTPVVCFDARILYSCTPSPKYLLSSVLDFTHFLGGIIVRPSTHSSYNFFTPSTFLTASHHFTIFLYSEKSMSFWTTHSNATRHENRRRSDRL